MHILVSSQETLQNSIFKIQLLYSFLNNICMFSEVLLEFDIELIYSSLWNIYLSCDFSRVQYSTPISSQETLRSSIFNSYMVPYLIDTCPVSSLDTLQSSIFNSNELIGDPPEFNIQLL